MALGEQVAKVRGVQLRVAVEPAPGHERERVDDAGMGKLGPGRLGEIERLHLGERFAPALGVLLAQLRVDLLLGHSFELAVVVEQTHAPPVLAAVVVLDSGEA